MEKVLRISNEQNAFLFFCPGCKCGHKFETPKWTFNNNFEKPTIRASILHPEGPGKKEYRCHCFVTDGKIQFLNDCTHDLKGQTVDMEDM